MNNLFNLPQYKAVFYDFKHQTGYYSKVELESNKSTAMRLPNELRYEQTRSEKIRCNASQIIVSKERVKNGSYKFMTGIQSAGIKNWYLGNDYEYKGNKKVVSLILFHFTDEFNRLSIYYFSGYDKKSKTMRLKFAKNVIPLLQNNKGRQEPPFNAFNLAIQTVETAYNNLGKNTIL